MRLGVRQRHHHVAAQEPDRVLHAALLVARARIAEPDLDPMMRNETLKHLHHHDPVPRDPVRRAGGVVRAPAPAARRRCARTPRAAPRTRTPRSPRATPPRTACSNTGTTPPGSARPSGSPQPRPEPNRNPPASRPATTPTPDTRHREADAPASSASHNAARSGTSRQTPAPRPACHTHAWPYAAACAA